MRFQLKKNLYRKDEVIIRIQEKIKKSRGAYKILHKLCRKRNVGRGMQEKLEKILKISFNISCKNFGSVPLGIVWFVGLDSNWFCSVGISLIQFCLVGFGSLLFGLV